MCVAEGNRMKKTVMTKTNKNTVAASAQAVGALSSFRSHAHIGTVRQLEILLTVYEHQSITKAAEYLHLTQPTVSMQISKLASTIGLELYYVKGKMLRFTTAGEAVVGSARQILKQFEYLDLTISNFKGLESGNLSLEVVTTAKYFIPHLMGEFYDRHPAIDIQFKVGNRQQIIDRTREDSSDFYVFSHPPEDKDLELIEFLPNKLIAIAPENHELAGIDNIPLSTFVQHPFLIREAGSGTRFAIERFIEQQNSDLNIRMTIESNEAIKHAVMSGLGVSILSEHTLSFGGLAGLVSLDVQGLPIMTRWYLARRKSRPLSPIATSFLDYVDERGRTLLETGL